MSAHFAVVPISINGQQVEARVSYEFETDGDPTKPDDYSINFITILPGKEKAPNWLRDLLATDRKFIGRLSEAHYA